MNSAEKDYIVDDYIFRLSLQCPAKISHHLEGFPISEKSLETVPFYTISKRLLKNLARYLLCAPSFRTQEGSRQEDRAAVDRWIRSGEEGLYFDLFAVYDQRFLGKALFGSMHDGVLSLYHMESKAIPMNKSHLNFDVRYSGNWVKRMQKSAFNQWVFQQIYPELEIRSFILFPKKQMPVGYDGFSGLLYGTDRHQLYEQAKGDSDVPPMEHYFVTFRVDQAFEAAHLGLPLSQEEPLRKAIEKAERLVLEHEKIKPPIGTLCKGCEYRPEHTDDMLTSGFWKCWSKTLKDPKEQMVFDLVGTSGREFMEQGLFTQSKVPLPEDWSEQLTALKQHKQPINLEHRRWLQVARAQGQKTPEELLQPALLDKAKAWKYPLYFLDFETITLSVANHAEGRPYHTYVPQYSVHILEEDGSLSHEYWMSGGLDAFTDIRMYLALAEVLLKRPGTLLHFSPTEQVLLKSIKKQIRQHPDVLPEDKQLALKLTTTYAKHRNMIDMKQFIEQHYYNKHMGGSLSLKAIYEAVCKQAGIQNLYTALEDGHVKNGNDALNALFAYYCDLNMSEQERQQLKQELLQYCAIDTLSMVQMLQYFLDKTPTPAEPH